MEQQKKAILVISFGTSHEDTRKKTIDRIEEKIQQEYPGYPLYRAWTSNVIRRKLKSRDGLLIDSIEEAFERMKGDGIRQVIIQPTHVINGIETDTMNEIIRSFAPEFSEMKIGTPLLTEEKDLTEIVQILEKEWKDLPEGEGLILMGHGTPHKANQIYLTLEEVLRKAGHENIYVGTVEGYPAIEDVVEEVKKTELKRVHLSPFMIVAGDHAKNDMAGEEEDSWKNQLLKEGFEVECYLKGLGECEDIQKMFVRHVREAK